MAKKHKHIYNWNFIVTVIAIIPIIILLYQNKYSDEKNTLKEQINIYKEKVAELESETDTEWHKKFNSQNNFYKNEFEKIEMNYEKEIELKNKNHEKEISKLTDSLNLTDKIIIDQNQAKEIAKTLLRYDAALEENKLLTELSNSQDSLLLSQYNIQKEKDSLYNRIIMLKDKEIEIYDEALFGKKIFISNSTFNTILFISSVILCLLSILIFKNSKKKSKSHEESQN